MKDNRVYKTSITTQLAYCIWSLRL